MLDLLINGIFTGIGTGVGSYVATTYAIRHIKVVEEKIATRVRGKDEDSAVRKSEP